MNLTQTDIAAVARYPELLRLISVRAQAGWVFLPTYQDGELELVTGARVWPDRWTDAFAIRNRNDAKAYRCDPTGGQVWGRGRWARRGAGLLGGVASTERPACPNAGQGQSAAAMGVNPMTPETPVVEGWPGVFRPLRHYVPDGSRRLLLRGGLVVFAVCGSPCAAPTSEAAALPWCRDCRQHLYTITRLSAGPDHDSNSRVADADRDLHWPIDSRHCSRPTRAV